VQENRAARVRMFAHGREEEVGRRRTSQPVRERARFFGGTRLDHALESGHATIARMMLVPFSVSSMLSASLRPGRWPGLRALTMPARGTDWQLRDGGRADEHYNDVDEHVDRAYGGFITSVPHGTPPVRRNGIRSAHSADAPRARLERILHDIAVQYSGLWRCRVLRTTRRHEAAFTSGTIKPWFN
jgi:hypothetical protein